MAAAKSGTDQALIKRPAVLAGGTGVVTAAALGGVYIAPTALHDIAALATAATGTPEGLATTVGVATGLVATAITAAATKSHWTTDSTTECGSVDMTQTRTYYDEWDDAITKHRCVHDGVVRQGALRGMGVRTIAVGTAMAVVSGVLGHLGVEHGMATVVEAIGTGGAAAGAVTALASLRNSASRPTAHHSIAE